MASLKTGGDLCHIFCAEEAAIPIKSYSPELIVHPYLPTERSLGLDKRDEKWQHEVGAAVDKIAEVLPRLDTLVIGPGLGRDAVMQEITRRLIGEAKTLNLPLVLDGDALYLVSLEPQLIQGYQNTILTPNAVSI
jgi:ATP-dependent NAD(P)H-hydrate dehydratase